VDSTNSGSAAFIQNDTDLSVLAKALQKEKILAVDTESNSLFAYREQVCLIQFSTKDADYMVDPFSVPDLSPIKPIFGDQNIEKVFHAAEYDLICLHRDYGFGVNNLFDTMIAARILGRQEIGLGTLLENEFGIHLEKKFQRANWGKRPISGEMLEYARMDTHYLIQLRDQLAAELERRDLMILAQEDFTRLAAYGPTNGSPITNNDRSIDIWRISGSYDLSPQQARVLFEICTYRDEAARKLNQPLFKVFGDKTLLCIAQQTPRNIEELSRLPGMSAGQLQRHGHHILQAVRHGLEAPGMHPRKNKRPDPTYAERLDRLRDWRKNAGAKMGVPSDVILPRDLLQRLTSENPRSRAELEQVLNEVPWRMEHFGEQILSVLRKE
jgi:ribonuclease D